MRRVGNRFQLWSGEALLKDFGPLEGDAHEALRVIREHHLDRVGTVGPSQPPFEYWLSGGDPPQATSFRRWVVPFDPATLRAERFTGAWVLRDARSMLFNFGDRADAAQRALAVCRKYGFNQIVVIGQPTPTMTYLVVDRSQAPQAKAKPSPGEQLQALDRLGLVLPKVGWVGDRIRIDPRRIALRQEQANWELVYGNEVLAHIGPSEREAREALRVMQDYRLTEYCKIGSTGFGFYLSNGQPPRGVPLGVQAVGFQPQGLKVQEVGGTWWLCDNNRPLFDFGDKREDAERALAAIKHFGFDQTFQIGHPLFRGLRVLAKGR